MKSLTIQATFSSGNKNWLNWQQEIMALIEMISPDPSNPRADHSMTEFSPNIQGLYGH
jgi:hypothetical protein